MEEIKTDRIKFYAPWLKNIGNEFYAGAGIDLANYFSIKTDSIKCTGTAKMYFVTRS